MNVEADVKAEAAGAERMLQARLDNATAAHAAARAEVERLQGRKAALAEEIAADEALIAGLENAATAAAIEGAIFDSATLAAAHARAKAKTAALDQIEPMIAAATSERTAAASAVDAAARLVEMDKIAAWIKTSAPAVGQLLDAVRDLDPRGSHRLADALAAALADPARGTAPLQKIRDDLRRAIRFGMTPPAGAAAAPVADTFIKSSRPFSFSYTGADRISAPSGWVGIVPRAVANLLVKNSAGKILPGLVIVETDGAGESSPLGTGARLTRKRLAPMTREEAEAAVAKGSATVTGREAGREAYLEKFGGDSLFWKGAPLDLGVIDAAPAPGDHPDSDDAAWSDSADLALSPFPSALGATEEVKTPAVAADIEHPSTRAAARPQSAEHRSSKNPEKMERK